MNLGEALASIPTLWTERLTLRPMGLADGEAFFAFKGNLEVTTNYGQEPHRSVEETRAWIASRIPGSRGCDSLFWTITLRDEGTVIGECCLWNFDPGFRHAEIGYEMSRAYWGRGLMNEALTAIFTYAFQGLGLDHIEATPLASNIRSQHLLLKLGFSSDGVLPQRHLFRGRSEEQLRFTLLKSHWIEQ